MLMARYRLTLALPALLAVLLVPTPGVPGVGPGGIAGGGV
jgi:hypothetical protein